MACWVVELELYGYQHAIWDLAESNNALISGSYRMAPWYSHQSIPGNGRYIEIVFKVL